MIDKSSLADQIYEHLKNQIINLKLKPGEKLNYDKITEELNISKTPLRDALKQLSNDGFVVIKPRSGTSVFVHNVKSINDVYDVRHSIELLALEKTFSKMQKKDIYFLLKNIEKSNQLILHGNYQVYFKVDREVHALWLKSTDNSHIVKIMESLESHIHWFSVLSTVYKTRPIESNKEHKDILNSILEDDLEKTKELLSHHISGAKNIVIQEFNRIDI